MKQPTIIIRFQSETSEGGDCGEGSTYVKPHTRRGKEVKGFCRKIKGRKTKDTTQKPEKIQKPVIQKREPAIAKEEQKPEKPAVKNIENMSFDEIKSHIDYLTEQLSESKTHFAKKKEEKTKTEKEERIKNEANLPVIERSFGNPEGESLGYNILKWYQRAKSYVEFRDGKVPIPHLFDKVKKEMPDITLDNLHEGLKKLEEDKKIWIHFVNNPALIDKPDEGIEREGRVYYYVEFR